MKKENSDTDQSRSEVQRERKGLFLPLLLLLLTARPTATSHPTSASTFFLISLLERETQINNKTFRFLFQKKNQITQKRRTKERKSLFHSSFFLFVCVLFIIVHCFSSDSSLLCPRSLSRSRSGSPLLRDLLPVLSLLKQIYRFFCFNPSKISCRLFILISCDVSLGCAEYA